MDVLQNTITNTAIIPEIWSAKFFDVNTASLPYIDCVNNDWEGEISALGDIINISQMPEFAEAQLLGEGAKGNASAVIITGQQLTINKRPYVDVIITKESSLQSLPFMDKLRNMMIYSLNKKIQTEIVNLIQPSTSAPDMTLAYDTGSTLALADILEAQELLNGQNVEKSNRIGILEVSQYSDLFNVTSFISRDYIPAGSPITTGVIETPVCGFTIKASNIGNNVSRWLHPSFMTIAFQQALNIELSNLAVLGERGQRLNMDLLMGIKQMDSKRVVSIS